jgi:hypothetical protein
MKHWYRSKTIWLGVLTIAMSGLTAAQEGASWQQIAIGCVGAAIILLRTVTDKPVGR